MAVAVLLMLQASLGAAARAELLPRAASWSAGEGVLQGFSGDALQPGGLGRALLATKSCWKNFMLDMKDAWERYRSCCKDEGAEGAVSDVAIVNDIPGHFEVLAGVLEVLNQTGVTPDVYYAGALHTIIPNVTATPSRRRIAWTYRIERGGPSSTLLMTRAVRGGCSRGVTL